MNPLIACSASICFIRFARIFVSEATQRSLYGWVCVVCPLGLGFLSSRLFSHQTQKQYNPAQLKLPGKTDS